MNLERKSFVMNCAKERKKKIYLRQITLLLHMLMFQHIDPMISSVVYSMVLITPKFNSHMGYLLWSWT